MSRLLPSLPVFEKSRDVIQVTATSLSAGLIRILELAGAERWNDRSFGRRSHVGKSAADYISALRCAVNPPRCVRADGLFCVAA